MKFRIASVGVACGLLMTVTSAMAALTGDVADLEGTVTDFFDHYLKQ